MSGGGGVEDVHLVCDDIFDVKICGNGSRYYISYRGQQRFSIKMRGFNNFGVGRKRRGQQPKWICKNYLYPNEDIWYFEDIQGFVHSLYKQSGSFDNNSYLLWRTPFHYFSVVKWRCFMEQYIWPRSPMRLWYQRTLDDSYVVLKRYLPIAGIIRIILARLYPLLDIPPYRNSLIIKKN